MIRTKEILVETSRSTLLLVDCRRPLASLFNLVAFIILVFASVPNIQSKHKYLLI